MLPDPRSRAGAVLLALALVTLPISPAGADEAPADSPTTSPIEPEPTPEPNPAPTTEPAEEAAPMTGVETARIDAPDEADPETREIDDAELRWGVTNESNNMSHAPGRFNFFSAGRIPDPGQGGYTVTQGVWKQKSGTVAIEKSNGTTYKPATWAGLKTTATGAPITSAGSGRFSDHQIVFSDGEGEIDPATGDGSIEWEGDATVIYYSGFTFFYVSDPELTIEDGVGIVRATLGGFASSQEDLGVWSPLPETEVILAELGAVDLKGDAKGFTASPSYLQRAVTGVDQVRQGPHWGAFPQSFINFHLLGGAAGFWYSSGSSFDAIKVPLPLTVSLDSEDAIDPEVPPPSSGGVDVTNDIVNPPNLDVSNMTPLPSNLSALTASADPIPAALSLSDFKQVASPATLLPSTLTNDDDTGATLWWWLGIVALTLAASSVAGTFAYSAASTRR